MKTMITLLIVFISVFGQGQAYYALIPGQYHPETASESAAPKQALYLFGEHTDLFQPSGKPTVISNPGMLMSNYEVQAQDVYQRWQQQFGAEKAETMASLCVEGKWPTGMRTLSQRKANAETIKQLVAYYFDDGPDDVAILYIPARQNAAAMRQLEGDGDFFMCIIKSGLELGDRMGGQAQAVSTTKAGGSVEPTKIINSGQWYSTLRTEELPAYQNMVSKYGKEAADYIVKRSHESNYPKGLRELGGWRNHKDDMQRYVAYYVEDVEADKVLLWIPAAENQHMPADMQDGDELFMIIGKSGVKLGDKIALPTNTLARLTNQDLNANSQSMKVATSALAEKAEHVAPKPPANWPSGFSAQLAALIDDIPNDYYNYKGKRQQMPGSELLLYSCNKKVTGTRDVFFVEDYLSPTYILIMEFGGELSEADARKLFERVIADVQNANPTMCKLMKSDLTEEDGTYTQVFEFTELKQAENYEDLLLEISLTPIEGKEGKFKVSLGILPNL